jgi:hypothetical protein
MLALGKFDVEAYCQLEEDLDLRAIEFWSEGDESSATLYAELRYFFCVATKNTLSELAGISYPSVKKALDRLERYRLVEHLGRVESYISDQLRAGEISLIETTPEEAEAAKARLNAQRKKRRERHAKKKHSQQNPLILLTR